MIHPRDAAKPGPVGPLPIGPTGPVFRLARGARMMTGMSVSGVPLRRLRALRALRPRRSRSPRSPRRGRAWTLLLAALLAGVSLLAGPATPASAHASLVRSVPQQNALVDTVPTEVVLTFSEGVRPVPGRVRVIAPDGSRADRADPTTDGNTVRVPLRSDAPQGTYLVTYRVISSDSHPVGGAFSFSVGSPSANGPPTDSGASQSASGFVTVAFPVARWIGFLGLLLLVGAVLVLAALWPQRLDRRGAARLIWVGAALIAVATLAEVALQIPYVAGGFGAVRASDVREALGSQFGAAHLIRLGALIAALIVIRPVAAGRGANSDRVLLAVLGVIGLATWPLSGHPSASPAPAITTVADLIHLGAMSVWLGGLVMLIFFLLPRATDAELAAIVPVWSRWAVYAVSALLLTGVAQALIEVGTVHALVSTEYGWLIVAKAGLATVIVSVALFSKRLVPAFEAQTELAPRRLRRLVIVEAAVAATVLGVASVLVQTTPARTAAEVAAGASYQTATLRSNLFTLQFDIQPAITGSNDLHLYAFTPDGKLADVKQWSAKASLASQQIEPIEVSLLALTPDHAVGTILLPAAGEWTFSFTLRTSDIDQATVTTTVQVSQ